MDSIRVGYDQLQIYTKEELENLYVSQGMDPKEASKLAKILYKELQSLIETERNLWRKVRKREKTGQSQEDMEDATGL